MHSFRRLTTAGFKCSKLIRLSWLKNESKCYCLFKGANGGNGLTSLVENHPL